VLVPAGHDFEVLLMKRSERVGDPWSGQISLPGGHSNPEDRDLVGTARREMMEEMGLELRTPPVGQLDDVHPKTSLIPPIVVRPYVFVVDHVQQLRLGREADLDLRVCLGELPKLQRIRTVTAKNRLLKVSGYSVGPHFVWGLTERVISNLLEILKKSTD